MQLLQKYSIEFRLFIIIVDNVALNNILRQNFSALLIENNVN